MHASLLLLCLLKLSFHWICILKLCLKINIWSVGLIHKNYVTADRLIQPSVKVKLLFLHLIFCLANWTCKFNHFIQNILVEKLIKYFKVFNFTKKKKIIKIKVGCLLFFYLHFVPAGICFLNMIQNCEISWYRGWV